MRHIPFFSNSDRRALLVLEWIVVLATLGAFLYTGYSGRDSSEATDSLRHHARGSGRQKSFIYAEKKEVLETFPFDPNTADSTALLRLGLAPWQVRSIYRYRAKHGRYHTPEDFRRLPGMTNEMWERLAPYIRIDRKFLLVENNAKTPSTSTQTPPDSTYQIASQTAEKKEDEKQHPRQEKLSKGSFVDLNTADTTELKKVPGIASFRANKIVAYRKQLGGFVSVEQAMEACEMPDDVLEWFIITPVQIRKININTASVQQMMKHPYISFYKAKDIVEYRRRKGNFSSIDDLVQHGLLSPEEKDRLLPYLEF